MKFNKALYQLDKGQFEEAEENILQAIREEAGNMYELIQIKCCYAEVLAGLERYKEAMECVEFILDNTDEYSDNGGERQTALELKKI